MTIREGPVPTEGHSLRFWADVNLGECLVNTTLSEGRVSGARKDWSGPQGRGGAVPRISETGRRDSRDLGTGHTWLTIALAAGSGRKGGGSVKQRGGQSGSAGEGGDSGDRETGHV